MEIIIAIVIVVVGAVIYFNRKPKSEATLEVPYKVETPVAETVKVEEDKKPRAKKAPAAKKTATKKTATIKPVTRKPKAK